jgi:putative transposase|tara:strand:+ start:111 stop:536 length:426 start_codon:yes stop_codon:yes gene_type:complete
MSKFKLAHVVWDCKYHIVLVPKYRYKVFDREVREAVKEELKKLCTWMRLEIIEGHVSKDHVHMCLAIPPKHAVSDVIGTLKGKTAIRMFNKFPELRKRYWGSHFWSRGYYANTVGKDEEMIRQYIKDQDRLDRLADQGRLF